jgi:predicted HTH transcriptional regulator
VKSKETYISELIAQGEHQQLDFKFEISDARKIARTFSAFANTAGGKLLIGVKDNGKIAGIRTEEEYYMAESAANLYCKPEVPFTAEKWTIDGKTILEILIPPSKERPHYARNKEDNWQAWIRVKDENLLANPVQLKVWEKKKAKKGIIIKYSKVEKLLLGYLREHPFITLSRFVHISHLDFDEAEDTLANLISFGIIKMEFDPDRVSYVLTEKGIEQEEKL